VKVLFFSPFANIWEHSFPEGLVAESFAQDAVEVTAVRCNGMLQVHCVAMSAAGVGADASLGARRQVCRACVKRRDLLTRELGIPAIIMDEWVDADIESRVTATIDQLDRARWADLEVDGIPLGRYAMYETWINRKLVSTELSDDVWAEYLGQLRNTLLTYFASQRILDREKPDAVIVYNDHYSVNHAFAAAARRAGIASHTIHGGSHVVRRAETLSILASDLTTDDIFRSEAWRNYQGSPIGWDEIDLVGGHLSGLFAANSAFAYSSELKGTDANELRKRLAIVPGVSVLLATMSSEDELMASRLIDAIPSNLGRKSLFRDQFEWVDHLLGYARMHPEVHLVLRLHPRMFPNKREAVLSPVVSRIMALRDDAPPNVTFNMPSDGIGLYDIMQIVDVLLNFHSSVGAELSAVGIPVVVPANADFFTYPSELNRIGHTVAEYAAQIDRALAEGWSVENSRRAFRWFAFLFTRVAVDFSDAVSSRPIAVRPKKPGVRLWLWRKFVYLFLQYGPMIRERMSLRSRRISPTSRAVFLDVVRNDLDSASDSSEWPEIQSSLASETQHLNEYLLTLCSTLWNGIEEPDSLAGRIRSSLAVASSA
jgi:hypothetical protein